MPRERGICDVMDEAGPAFKPLTYLTASKSEPTKIGSILESDLRSTCHLGASAIVDNWNAFCCFETRLPSRGVQASSSATPIVTIPRSCRRSLTAGRSGGERRQRKGANHSLVGLSVVKPRP